MIISPCAMLMTPITPNVMARPMAASSSTEPRLIPWNRLSASSVSFSRVSIRASKAVAAARICGSGSAKAPSAFVAAGGGANARTSGVRRFDRSFTAASRSAASVLLRLSFASVRARAARTSSTFSRASTSRSSATASGELERAMVSAAANRLAGSGSEIWSRPTAAPMLVRRALFTLMRVRSLLEAAPSASPVAASIRVRSRPPLPITTRPSALRVKSLLSDMASRAGMARLSPSRDSVSMAATLSAKAGDARPVIAVSNSSARADDAATVPSTMPQVTRPMIMKMVMRAACRLWGSQWAFAELEQDLVKTLSPGMTRLRPRPSANFRQAEGRRSGLLLGVGAVLRLSAVAAHPGEGPIGRQLGGFGNVRAPGGALDRVVGLGDDRELTVGLDFADHHRLGQVMVGVHHDVIAAGAAHLLAVHGLPDGVDLGRAGLEDGLGPHLEADIMRFHRVVGHPLVVFGEGVPLLDEGGVFRRIDRHEVVPGGKVADQI